MTETILNQTVRMLHKERLDRAEHARVVRRALNHRTRRDEDPPKLKTSRATCRRTGQVAY